MRRVSALLLGLTVLTLAVFAPLAMGHAADAAHDGCLAAKLQGQKCVAVANAVETANFYVGAFAKIFQTVLSILVIALALVFAGQLSAIPNQALLSFSRAPDFSLPRPAWLAWLARHEHSPTL